jgi:uncharacterized protein
MDSEASVELADGTAVGVTQTTDYPWDGHVRLTISPVQPREFTLCLRIPDWARGRPVPSDLYRFAEGSTAPVALRVNGTTVDTSSAADGYVRLTRCWSEGDTVELHFPMPVRRVYAHEKVEADRGKVALMRGPIVYCLEGVDHPDVDITTIALPPAAELTAEHRPNILGGVTVITGTAVTRSGQTCRLTAVPYYAWCNRAKGPMQVWIDETPLTMEQ